MIIAAFFVALVVQASPPASEPKSGKIIIYRPSTVVGAIVACPVRFKGKEIVELGRGKFAEWTVAPGRYILSNKTSSVEVTVDPGETRFVRCSMKMGILTFRADLQIVDQESFDPHRAEFDQKPIAEFAQRNDS